MARKTFITRNTKNTISFNIGYSYTVHKVPGLKLKKVVVSFDLLKKRLFKGGET